jgi:hypothetical protein
MSLKAFHVVFIFASILLAFGFAGWSLHHYKHTGARMDLILGVGSGVVGIALLIYGKYFLRKLKNISYL